MSPLLQIQEGRTGRFLDGTFSQCVSYICLCAGPTVRCSPSEMRGLGCLLLLALTSQALAARQLKWGWSSAHSLGQLTTATGANTNAGLLSTYASVPLH